MLDQWLAQFAGFMWGPWLVLLLVGGGLYFCIHSGFKPFMYFKEGIAILWGKYDQQSGQGGQLRPYQALATALSGTLGLGNVAGVAAAISIGGPGAIFWMWISAIIGVATKFYTATLAVMFRGKDSAGELQGGPMYIIREALPKKLLPLAYLFAIAGLIGTSPIFQVNQLTEIVREVVAYPMQLAAPESHFSFDLIFGLSVACIVFGVVSGRIQRIGKIAGLMVPIIVLGYLAMTLWVIGANIADVPAAFKLIVVDAFTGEAAAGGVVGAVIMLGVRRGAFSNEAGIGTESLAHGAAKTSEPVREGLVAMLGPIIDTLIVCTCTALVLILTGVWQGIDGLAGVSLTARAFELAMPGFGSIALLIMVVFLSLTTVFTFWYYGTKCASFLFGANSRNGYTLFYLTLVVLGALGSVEAVFYIMDGFYAMMAIPTMISTIWLAPKVKQAADKYFADLRCR